MLIFLSLLGNRILKPEARIDVAHPVAAKKSHEILTEEDVSVSIVM